MRNANPDAKHGKCPECGNKTYMTGRHQAFNPSIDDKKVCIDCFVKDVKKRILAGSD